MSELANIVCRLKNGCAIYKPANGAPYNSLRELRRDVLADGLGWRRFFKEQSAQSISAISIPLLSAKPMPHAPAAVICDLRSKLQEHRLLS